MNFYKAYGLSIRSDIALAELPQAQDGDDLYIQRAEVHLPEMTNSRIPRQGIEAWFGGSGDKTYLDWPGVAKFCAWQGKRLLVEPYNASLSPQVLSLYTLSEALGLILHQRNLLLIHASAIQVGDQAIIFAGMPGAGKSTTAAAFAQAGYPVISDDMVAIDVSVSQCPKVIPAFPQVKIWPSSMEGLGYEKSKLEPLFPGSPKQVIRHPGNFPTASLPLTNIFFLEKGSEFCLNPMDKAKSILEITKFFSCPKELLQGQALALHFQQCSTVVNYVPVWTLQRPNSFEQLKQFVGNIDAFLAECSINQLSIAC